MAGVKSVTVLERFVRNPDGRTYDFDGHLEADIEVRTRYVTEAGRRRLEGEFLAICVDGEMISIPLACVRDALGMPSGVTIPVETSHANPH